MNEINVLDTTSIHHLTEVKSYLDIILTANSLLILTDSTEKKYLFKKTNSHRTDQVKVNVNICKTLTGSNHILSQDV